MLGLGHADELAPLTIMSGIYDNTIDVEKVFPGDQDIVHLRYLYRPEVKDIDVYRFTAPSAGTVTAESIAERLGVSEHTIHRHVANVLIRLPPPTAPRYSASHGGSPCR